MLNVIKLLNLEKFIYILKKKIKIINIFVCTHNRIRSPRLATFGYINIW